MSWLIDTTRLECEQWFDCVQRTRVIVRMHSPVDGLVVEQHLVLSIIYNIVTHNVCAPTEDYDDSVPAGTTSIHQQRIGASPYDGNDVESYAQHKGGRKLLGSCPCRVLRDHLSRKYSALKLTLIYCRQWTGHVQVQPERSLVW